MRNLNGALLIDKHEGVTSFGVVESIKRALKEKTGLKFKELPGVGHGGTLDPFATGLLIVFIGQAAKLARYFLSSSKEYEGVIRFGETTIPGDPTEVVSERSDVVPRSLEEIAAATREFTDRIYQQLPPMHSAKKHQGKPLYELARQGLEVERSPKICPIHRFEILEYSAPRAQVRVHCGSGTYVRTLAQDLGKKLGTVAMLDSLRRTESGGFSIDQAWRVPRVLESQEPWISLPCWVPFDRILENRLGAIEIAESEKRELLQGRQNALFNILARARPAPDNQAQELPRRALMSAGKLAGVIVFEDQAWKIEKLFGERS